MGYTSMSPNEHQITRLWASKTIVTDPVGWPEEFDDLRRPEDVAK